MRVLERHEMKIVCGGFSSDPFEQWRDEGLNDVLGWMNGREYGDEDFMGEAFGDLMSRGYGDALHREMLVEIPTNLPANPDGSLMAAITAGLFGLIGMDTGFDPQTGLRRDGLPAGAGCGNKSTDWIVPDRIGNVDLVAICRRHDRGYADQIGKDFADLIFRKEVHDAFIDAGKPRWYADLVADVYYTAVKNLGQASYDEAGAKAGVRH
ncbi:hypothetical protein [Roseateles sp.]|uniref:hypothetical protein n=1 Tax=Roseateles sp. TaxID=1971397 RepID=UPI0031D231CD